MKQETLFLRIAVFLIGAPVVALCIFLVPWANKSAEHYQELASLKYPVLIGLYVTAVAFFFALYQALKLLSYIDKNKAFSQMTVGALKYIKYCALIISAFYVVGGLPLLYHMAEIDDAPGMIVLGLVIIFASTVIAVFAAVLQRLLQEAIKIKSENDLTV